MKYIISTIALIALFALIPNGMVFATVEADGTARLAWQEAKSDTRVSKLTSYLAYQNSLLTAEASHFVAEADRLNLDWKFVAAISGVESTFGKFTPTGSYNGWGWGIPTGAQWGVAFKDWKEGITSVSEGLRYNYIDKGAVTIEQIGRIYAASPTWSWKVRFFMDQIQSFAPIRPNLIEVTL